MFSGVSFRLFLLFIYLFLRSADASAGEETAAFEQLAIEIDGPEKCVRREAVVENVASMLGNVSLKEDGRRFRGEVFQNNDEWIARLTVDDGSGRYERVVAVRSCEAAVDVLSLLIALAVDPIAVLASDDAHLKSSLETLNQSTDRSADGAREDNAVSTPPPADERDTEKKAAPPQEKPDAESTAAPAPKMNKSYASVRLTLGMDFVGDVGFTSAFHPGVGLFATLGVRRFCVELSTRFLPRQREPVPEVAGAEVQSLLAGISLGAGARFRLGPVQIAPLIGTAAHGVFAETTGVASPGDGKVWFSSLWVGISLDWVVAKKFGLRFFPSVHYLPERPRFEIEGVGTVIRPYAAAANLNLGVFFRFWS